MRKGKPDESSSCFGFVCFHSSKDAAVAIDEGNKKMVGGKMLYCSLAQYAQERKDFLEQQFSKPMSVEELKKQAVCATGAVKF